jgi:hypothetical protein
MYCELTDEHKAIIARYIAEVVDGRMRMRTGLLLANLEIVETLPVPEVFALFVSNWIWKVKQHNPEKPL